MPNHITNYIWTTKRETLKELHESSKDLNGGFAQLLMPMPAEYSETGWWEWRTSDVNWGTKWGSYRQEFEETDTTLSFINPNHLTTYNGKLKFETAWDRISQNLFDKLLNMFPNITYEYECESQWGGVRSYANGQEILDLREDYDTPFWSDAFFIEGVDIEHTYLERDHRQHKKGWYYYWSKDEPVTCEETLIKLNDLLRIRLQLRR
tara:strand:+ start:499 stop:1119 length:621 start_codon:yes stop_codon:yes gene_type:complete